MSAFAEYLHHQQFTVLIEYLCGATAVEPTRDEFAGFPAVMTLADRVQSDHDISPLAASQQYPKHREKVLHYAGKGRDIADFQQFLQQAEQADIKNLLLLTGDKLKQHQSGAHGVARSRYLESVNAVMAAKAYGGFHLGVAFNPFKYTEAERTAQYLKLQKKIKAGADYVITQLGYDLHAIEQLQQFLQNLLQQHDAAPKLLVCVMPLSLARANFMLKNKVAGIVITPYMLRILEQEKQQGMTERVYLRCAVQMLICEKMGLAGVHLSGCHKPEQQQRLIDAIEQYRQLNLTQLQALWQRLWQITTEQAFVPELPQAVEVSVKQQLKYRSLDRMHRWLFASKWARGMGRYIFQQRLWNQNKMRQWLVQGEHLSKHAAVGCESCGQCRLADTLYICPETCPKGLANGPCGGTDLDRCEFGDRECIHSVKARLAVAVAQTEILREKLIPTVSIEIRGSSSWKNWYLAE